MSLIVNDYKISDHKINTNNVLIMVLDEMSLTGSLAKVILWRNICLQCVVTEIMVNEEYVNTNENHI